MDIGALNDIPAEQFSNSIEASDTFLYAYHDGSVTTALPSIQHSGVRGIMQMNENQSLTCFT